MADARAHTGGRVEVLLSAPEEEDSRTSIHVIKHANDFLVIAN